MAYSVAPKYLNPVLGYKLELIFKFLRRISTPGRDDTLDQQCGKHYGWPPNWLFRLVTLLKIINTKISFFYLEIIFNLRHFEENLCNCKIQVNKGGHQSGKRIGKPKKMLPPVLSQRNIPSLNVSTPYIF